MTMNIGFSLSAKQPGSGESKASMLPDCLSFGLQLKREREKDGVGTETAGRTRCEGNHR